jgi:hypothetical protein
MLFAGRGGYVPWWGNFVLLAPTWGLLGVLALVASWREAELATDEHRSTQIGQKN